MKLKIRTTVSLLALMTAPDVAAEDAVVLDEVSVTATREERATKDVPQSITVIGKERIEDTTVMNIKDAISGTPGVLIDSRSGGYDSRLMIRGAGLKARYGVREIMVLRDGVPMTDPDSFTRFDFIDTQDIEQVEIVKGPGSIYATGSAGGTIQILSKSVFDEDNVIKLGIGEGLSHLLHGRVGGMITDNQALSLSVSRRASENDWRRWNEFETNQASLKHGWMLGNGGVLESEISYSMANLQLPGSMNQEQFEEFLRTGTQEDTKDPWKHSGRYSNILFANTRYEQEWGPVTFKPRVYATWWQHYHPVTGFINVSDGNFVYGTDLEAEYKHELLGARSNLVAGLTLRQDISQDSRKYTYGDVLTETVSSWSGSITSILETLSDDKGDLAEVQDSVNTLYGIFAQESIHLSDDLLLDVGFRLDQSVFSIESFEYIGFDYANTAYTDGAGYSEVDTSFTLFSPKVGLTYAVTPNVSVYGVVAQAGQVPSTSELSSNPDLEAAVATNFEIGLKARYQNIRLDTSLYYSPVSNEIVSQRVDGETIYDNAGETSKLGFEIAASYEVMPGLEIGGGYAYSDFTFDEYNEVVYINGAATNVSRAGNRLPFIPQHQYALFLDYKHPSGFKARVQTESWGEYFTDYANTETYEGYDFVTDVMVGYDLGPHSFMLTVDNVFDQHYASEVYTDTSGETDYYAASPRTVMFTYRLKL